MVTSDILPAAALIAQAAAPARKVEPADAAPLFAMLFGLVLLGLALVVLTWLGARATRRYMASGRSKIHVNPDDWAKKPLDGK